MRLDDYYFGTVSQVYPMNDAPWSALARVRLAQWPTPLERLDRFSQAIGADVWIKRDDVHGVGLAGNKVRKLEFVLADARANGADTLVTIGAEQSNAARATAAAAARIGMACVLVLAGDAPAAASGNLLLDGLFGAEVRFAGTRDWGALDAQAKQVCAELREQGRRPYALPAGSSSGLGAIGFVSGWSELIVQLAELGVDPAAVVHASASGGTQAGLLLGRELSGGGPAIRGVAVATGVYPDMPAHYAKLAHEAAAIMGIQTNVTADDVQLDWRWVGDGYGIPTPEGVDAVALLARTEGIVCDVVYTGKALAALIAGVRNGSLNSSVVFWHTGGYQAMFAPAYADVLWRAVRGGARLRTP